MLKIRLSKTGKRNAPSFRITVVPGKHPRDGKALEVLGHFNPSSHPPNFSLDKERLKYWIGHGAQMTEAVRKLAEGKYEFKPYRPKKERAKELEKRAVKTKPEETPGKENTGQETKDKNEGLTPKEKA